MRPSLLQSWLLERVLSLPAAALRFLSGGGVVHVVGRTLDPQIQFLWRSWFNRQPGVTPLGLTGRDLDQAQTEWGDVAELTGTPSHLNVRYEAVGGDAASSTFGLAPINGLLIRPHTIAPDAPLLVFFHQGGGVLGGSALSRAFCAVFADAARCPVLIPDYRLAPANRFPAALDDARLAFDWAQQNAQRLGANDGQVAIGGALMGANLAARLCLDLKREFKPLPAGQLLITPLIDLADPGMKTAHDGIWPLTPADLEVMIANYAGAGVELTDPRISPAREPMLVGQPRSMIVSAGLDPLAAQGEAFARRLLDSRVRALYRRYDSLPLGFDLFAGVVAAARGATIDIARTWIALLRQSRNDAGEVRDVA